MIAVLRGNGVQMLAANSGEATWSWSLPKADDGVRLKQLQWDKDRILVIGERPGSTGALYVAALDSKGKLIGEAKEQAGSWADSLVITAPSEADDSNALAHTSGV